MLKKKVRIILEEVNSTSEPLFFLTNSKFINSYLNKQRKYRGEPEVEYVPNFREGVAFTQPYKGGREEVKPHYYYSLVMYILERYNCVVNEEGLEADDAMCIEMSKDPNSIICTRDKDLKQCPGWHYTWECGGQPSHGPIKIDELGYLEREQYLTPAGNKASRYYGGGDKFFYFQMITGDGVDNIPGIKGKGPVAALNLFKDCVSSREMYEITRELYKKQYDDFWKDNLKERADLLYMIREVKDGLPVKWRPPKK